MTFSYEFVLLIENQRLTDLIVIIVKNLLGG